MEFDLLACLARRPVAGLHRENLLREVWGYQHASDTRLVNVHVQRLRAKVERDPDNPQVVLTVRGVGYKAGPPVELPARRRVAGHGDGCGAGPQLRGAERAARWSGSLVLRTVLTTLGLSVVVVALVATVLVNRVTAGLLDAKQDRSLTEATDDWERALRLLAAADAGPATASPDRIVDGVVADLARNAGSPPGYEMLLLQAPSDSAAGPERATNLISPDSVPAQLATERGGSGGAAVDEHQALLPRRQQRACHGGRRTRSRCPGAGDYQLFHVFPYTEEQGIIGLVRSATLVAGVLLVVLLGRWSGS